MIPRTFPSTVDSNGRRSMTIFPLTSYSLSGRWKDWIPVKGGGTAGKENTYAEDGGQVMTMLESISGMMAWKDYVPVVFVDGPTEDAWDVGKVHVPDVQRGYVLAANGSDAPTAVFNFADNSFQTTGMTFTRAGDRSATVRDHNGIVWPVKANEMRMEGLRRVENLVPTSQTIDNVYWVKTEYTVLDNHTISPNGSLTAAKIIPRNNTTGKAVYAGAFSGAKGYCVVSVYAKPAGYDWIRLSGGSPGSRSSYFNIRTGIASGALGGAITAIEQAANGFFRCSIQLSIADAYCQIECGNADGFPGGFQGNGTDGVVIWGCQYENVVTTQTTPSEYVSTGVLSSPYHGYFADGVKYFTTTTPGSSTEIPAATRKGLLVEQAMINSCLRSEEFNTNPAPWNTAAGAASCTISGNTAIAPSGNQSADSIVEGNGVATNQVVYQGVATSIGVAYTGSCYVKPAGRTYCRIGFTDSATDYMVIFNLTGNGSISQTDAGISGVVESFQNGWYRLSVTRTVASTGVTFFIAAGDNGTNRVGYVPTSGLTALYLWGGQFEAASYPTEYIPTTSAAVTRNMDSCVVTYNFEEATGTIVSFSTINQYVPGNVCGTLSINDGSGNNRIDHRIYQTTWQGYLASGGVNYVSFSVTAPTKRVEKRVAESYQLNNVVLKIDGANVTTDPSATMPVSLTTMNIGTLEAGAYPMTTGTIRKIDYYNKVLNPTAMESITVL